MVISTDTVISAKDDTVPVVSRQGRPLRNAPAGPDKSGHTRNAYMTSIHPEIDDFRMEQSAISGQRSAKNLVIMRFLLKAESETLIALIRK
jgi:hypothetical protein